MAGKLNFKPFSAAVIQPSLPVRLRWAQTGVGLSLLDSVPSPLQWSQQSSQVLGSEVGPA